MSNEIIRYYDSNTDRFLKYGQGAESKAIHRAVWAPGIETRLQAMNYVNTLIAAALRNSAPDSTAGDEHAPAENISADKVLDIGCGVGGSMLYLAGHTSASISGVTISPRQAEVGQQLIAATGCAERCSIVCADFTDSALPERLPLPFDTAYAIESFLHMPDAELFFKQVARSLRPGGKLYLCDDFLASQAGRLGTRRLRRGAQARRQKLLQRFKRGWQVQSLCTTSELCALAAKHGLRPVHIDDLSPYLELNRPRDIGIRILIGLLGRLPIATPFWNNLLGGDALQRLLLRGDIRYLLLQFEKTTSEYSEEREGDADSENALLQPPKSD